VEVMEEAGDVERMVSGVASIVVSTIEVGLDRAIGNASRGVRDDEGLEEESSPPCSSDPAILAHGGSRLDGEDALLLFTRGAINLVDRSSSTWR
jgi:hypothetical protein